MENICIMADSEVISIEIPMMISMENYTVGHDTYIFHVLTGVGHEVYTSPWSHPGQQLKKICSRISLQRVAT